jgi:hypothetical protein
MIDWIEVSTALPDDDATVLVYLPEDENVDVWLGYFDADNGWLDPDGMSFQSPVTHWAIVEPPE